LSKRGGNFYKKLDLMMDLVVKWDLGGGAHGIGKSGHDHDPKSAVWYDDRGKKGTKREHSLLKSWQVQSLLLALWHYLTVSTQCSFWYWLVPEQQKT
jgi:hypothetical protein